MDMYGHNQQYVLASHMAAQMVQQTQQHQVPVAQVTTFTMFYQVLTFNQGFHILFLTYAKTLLPLATLTLSVVSINYS